MGFLSKKVCRKNYVDVQYFKIGEHVYVNKVEGRGEIPPHTRGEVISYYGNGIYGVEVEGYAYGANGLGVYGNDMEKRIG